MRRTTKLERIGFAFSVLGFAGCAEEKALPAKSTITASPVASNNIEASKPEKEDPVAREIVNAALKAHTGGKPDRLDKLKSHHLLLKGGIVLPTNGQEVDCTRETWAAWPDRYAYRFTIDSPGFGTTSGIATNSEGQLRSINGEVTPIAAVELKSVQWDCFALEWGGTVVALANPASLFHQPNRVISGGRVYQSVKCYTPNQPEWTYWFDANTHLLEQIHYVGMEGSSMKAKVVLLSEFADYQDVKLPKRFELRIGGTMFFRLNVSAFETPEKFDAKMFTEPPPLR